MEVYIEPIRFAFLFFPLIAFLLTLPFLIIQYHKYGGIPIWRSAIFYTFILYLISAFFLVIMPLPTREDVLLMPDKIPQLIPFHFILDIMNNISFDSIISFFKSPVIYTLLFNLALTLPFGIYLRYYFEKRWYQVLLWTFGLSLFFEITQLTGIYGIYPKAYRLFDVDDLIINTLGGMIGYFITPVFQLFLPSRKQIDEKSYEKGKNVSIYRRLTAFLIDGFFVSLIFIIITIFFGSRVNIKLLFITVLVFYYFLFVLLTNGYTIGKYMVRIRLSSSKHPSLLFIAFHQLLLYGFILPSPIYISQLLSINSSGILEKSRILLIIFNVFMFIYFMIQFCLSLFIKGKKFWYEKLTRTNNISTIADNISFDKSI